MRGRGTVIGHLRVSRLIDELGPIYKQSSKHGNKQATVEWIEIPKQLNRQFAVDASNQVWCGDIAHVWVPVSNALCMATSIRSISRGS
ncbi:hypothetical protein [Ralstonia wenshanensis]|uniref:Transposase n=1 Tax=Ralstonia wenshanensis TaxID=2842456 RepID=A0AAD2AXB2_9RALS|nr:hypothetical protein [Ralstonia wenshanensis]CAJ0692723.1 hypothetical protein LMG18091_01660 [Ralstonia wenshanensis]